MIASFLGIKKNKNGTKLPIFSQRDHPWLFFVFFKMNESNQSHSEGPKSTVRTATITERSPHRWAWSWFIPSPGRSGAVSQFLPNPSPERQWCSRGFPRMSALHPTTLDPVTYRIAHALSASVQDVLHHSLPNKEPQA